MRSTSISSPLRRIRTSAPRAPAVEQRWGERILQQNLELRQGRFGAGEPEGTQQGRAQRRIVVLLEPGLEVLRERKLRQRAVPIPLGLLDLAASHYLNFKEILGSFRRTFSKNL